jgi:hypothetical protein
MPRGHCHKSLRYCKENQILQYAIGGAELTKLIFLQTEETIPVFSLKQQNMIGISFMKLRQRVNDWKLKEYICPFSNFAHDLKPVLTTICISSIPSLVSIAVHGPTTFHPVYRRPYHMGPVP